MCTRLHAARASDREHCHSTGLIESWIHQAPRDASQRQCLEGPANAACPGAGSSRPSYPSEIKEAGLEPSRRCHGGENVVGPQLDHELGPRQEVPDPPGRSSLSACVTAVIAFTFMN